VENSKFDRFIKEQQKNNEDSTSVVFSPKKQLSEWLDYIDILYKEITHFMESYTSKGMSSISYEDITLTENFSGSYKTRRLLLQIGRSKIAFTPIATMLIGSKGRVDVQGPTGGAQLILISDKVTNARQLITVRVSRAGEAPPPLPKPQNIKWVWKILSSPPKTDFINLTYDSFSDMILNVSKL